MVSKDFLERLPGISNGAGCWDHLKDLLVELLKIKKTIRESVLPSYTTRRKLEGFFDEGQRMRRITSPFPINPSRRDLVLLSAGVWPGFFRNRQPEVMRRQKGIAVFLDVSGSVNDYLPQIIGILSGLRDRIRTVHLFSNTVVEVPFGAVCQGKVQTTYGTDFDCIAKAILAKEYERAAYSTGLPPPRNDRHSMLEWYWEPAHYRAVLGDLMLAAMLGRPCGKDASLPPFGVRITPVTLQRHLDRHRSDMNRFVDQNPEVLKRLSAPNS